VRQGRKAEPQCLIDIGEAFRISNFEFPFPFPFLMEDTLLTTDGVSKRFGHIWALQGVGFTLRHGEVVGLIGPNGSGKTTFSSASPD
jgi:ABC-type multidrug transport system fused ATPase/permease subunit